AAIEFQEGLGEDAIRRRNAELVAYTRARLGEEGGLEPATPAHAELHGFMTAFRLPPDTDAARLRRGPWGPRVWVPVIERPEGLLLRVSTHFYNTEEEIDRLVNLFSWSSMRAWLDRWRQQEQESSPVSDRISDSFYILDEPSVWGDFGRILIR